MKRRETGNREKEKFGKCNQEGVEEKKKHKKKKTEKISRLSNRQSTGMSLLVWSRTVGI